MLVIRAQSELDERASVRGGFGLPIIVRLIALHRLLSLVIPHAGRLPRQVVLTDQGLLNFQGALRIDFLLAAMAPVPRTLLGFLAFVGRRVRSWSLRVGVGLLARRRRLLVGARRRQCAHQYKRAGCGDYLSRRWRRNVHDCCPNPARSEGQLE